jgi:nitroimidazol reductase NimA-like FMN-containing flavoprotein (pyridoxamine 5'-phosphate oxidase superfamily)
MTFSAADQAILAEVVQLASGQPGGTLATMHAEDGTPYVTFVLFHMDGEGRVLFGSTIGPQHSRNLRATPEVSFLIDNRDVIAKGWQGFNRAVIEGRAERIARTDARYQPMIEALRGKSAAVATFAEQGELYCIVPRRLQYHRGLALERYVLEFAMAAQ